MCIANNNNNSSIFLECSFCLDINIPSKNFKKYCNKLCNVCAFDFKLFSFYSLLLKSQKTNMLQLYSYYYYLKETV